jgi:16S rRNA C967 or C1407 C5-methylase (RsmB/RsmF family)
LGAVRLRRGAASPHCFLKAVRYTSYTGQRDSCKFIFSLESSIGGFFAQEMSEEETLANEELNAEKESFSFSFPPAFLCFLNENSIDCHNFQPLKNRFLRFKYNNNLKSEFECESKVLLRTMSWFPSFFSLDSQVKISNNSLYKNGLAYGMDIASGVTCHALDIQPSDHILDLCCAPGAKLCFLFDLLGKGTGTVTGVDISKHRLYTAKSIVQKYKLDRVRLFLCDGTKFNVPPPSRIGPVIVRESKEELLNSLFLKPFHATKLIRNDDQKVLGFYDSFDRCRMHS